MGPTIDGARRILRLEIGQLKIEITKSQIGPARVTGGGWHRQQNLRFCNCAPGDRQEVGDERALQSKE